MNGSLRRQSGITLIELIMVVVLLGIVGVGMLTLIHNTTRSSADPLLIQQGNSIARSYLEEALLRPFCDPDFVTTSCPVDCAGVNACTSCTGAEGSRNLFDDVCDYDGLSDGAGAVDQTGAAIAGLEDFNVSVTVQDDANADLNGLLGNSGQVVRVDVNVTHDSNTTVNVQLNGYRTNF